MRDTNSTDHYRALAARLVRLAATARSPEVRSQLLATAALYRKLADHADNWNDFLADRAA